MKKIFRLRAGAPVAAVALRAARRRRRGGGHRRPALCGRARNRRHHRPGRIRLPALVCLRRSHASFPAADGSRRRAFYAGWDDEYFYFAVRVSCRAPHSSYQDDEAGHYIFNGHSLMTALVPEDPAADKYRPSNGEYWLWQEAYDAGVCFEWTTILDSAHRYGRDRKPFPVADRARASSPPARARGRLRRVRMRIAFSASRPSTRARRLKRSPARFSGWTSTPACPTSASGMTARTASTAAIMSASAASSPTTAGTNASACARLRLAETAAEESVAETPGHRRRGLCPVRRACGRRTSARRWRSGSPVPQEQRHRRRGR